MPPHPHSPATARPRISICSVHRTAGCPRTTCWSYRAVAGQWTPSAWLEFSGQNQEGDLRLSPDGTLLFFWSYRAGPQVESPLKQESDIWFVEREGAGWGSPKRLDEPINSPQRDYMGSFAADGTLYFASLREDWSIAVG
jgi:hypothetical protein